MYMVAQLIIERVSGVSFEKFVTERIIRHLFDSTTYNSTWALETGRMADGFGLAQLNASSGGKGWIKAINQPVPLFLQDDFQHLIAGAGGVLMSGHDSVSRESHIHLDAGLLIRSSYLVSRLLGFRHSFWGVGIRKLESK